MNTTSFASLPLSAEILQNLETLQYHEMTPIQAQALPLILNNQDIIAKAKTGSGKTAAFGLGLLAKIDTQMRKVQALVICPTRELAEQVGIEIRRLARLTPNMRLLVLSGGKPVRLQTESLKNGTHIVVGTPGRIQDHLDKKNLILSEVNTLVLDEADRMLDMNFYDEIMHIVQQLPAQRQTLLFSATYEENIQKVSKALQKNAIEISLTSQEEDAPQIQQISFEVTHAEKNQALMALLSQYGAQSVIIFCKTKVQCDEVASSLQMARIHALALHGDLEQRDRDEVLLQFANHSCSILVATDVAARGLDIPDVPLVINYDLPASPEVYVHRIGRTGRAGKKGTALSLYVAAERFRIEAIQAYTQTVLKTEHIKIKSKPITLAPPPMRTLCIQGGKKDKVRAGDILGALTGAGGIAGQQVGKINIIDNYSYVAIDRAVINQAVSKLKTDKIKGRTFKIRYLNNT